MTDPSSLLHFAHDGRYGHFINGQFVDGHSATFVDSINPVNGEPWYQISDANMEDVDAAVRSAREALKHPSWSGITQTARGKMIRRLADLIGDHGPRLAEIETRDNGKLIKEMQAQMTAMPDAYHYFAGMADKIHGETIPINKSHVFNYTVREPIGVLAVIIPWNSPLYLLASALAPSLAIGNTVVVKPAENTSASALEFADLVRQAGFPPGVFNVITGIGETAGHALSSHPGVNKIAFTGGTDTGRVIASNAAQNLVPCTMELGGKSPHVVFSDADPERAANGIVAGVFAAGGQTCIAGSRCFLQEPIYDQVLERLNARASDVVIGDPMDEATELGPLALKAQLERVERYVGLGIGDGGQVQAGGKRPGAPLDRGYFFEPTVFTDVTNDMRIAEKKFLGRWSQSCRLKTRKN